MQSLYPTHIIHPPPIVSMLKTLTFGIEELGQLFGGLELGDLAVLHGSRMCHLLSELLCGRSQLPHAEGGLDSTVVFIDGGNIFDPYYISETALQYGLKPEEVLSKIWISRAFTAYQLTALITEELTKILDREDSRLVIVSDIPALYCDPDIGLYEAKNTFNRITRFLSNLAWQKSVLVVTTSLSSRSERKRRLEQYLFARASLVAGVEGGNPHATITLQKHPTRPSDFTEFCLGAPTTQSLLADFAEV